MVVPFAFIKIGGLNCELTGYKIRSRWVNSSR
jgi:hypothetical protein